MWVVVGAPFLSSFNCVAALFVKFPPYRYSLNFVFFIFYGSFSNFFLSLAWMRINETGRAYFFISLRLAFNFAPIKCRLLRFVWQVLYITCRCNYCYCFVFLVFCVLLRVLLQFVVIAELAALLPVWTGKERSRKNFRLFSACRGLYARILSG